MGRKAGINFNKAEVDALEPKDKIYYMPDSETRGLNLQVTTTGTKTWVLRFRVHGHSKMHSLGRWPEVTTKDARRMAIQLQGGISEGKDPAAKRKAERDAETVNELAKRFRKEHLPCLRPSSRRLYELALKRWILPALGSMRAKDVEPSDVATLLSKIRSETPKGVMANRTRAVISKMFVLAALWGMRRGLPNPAQGQVTAKETKKDRHLSDKELIVLGATLRHLEPKGERPDDALPPEDIHALAAFRLFLLTGMRKSELIGDRKRDKVTQEIIEDIPALPISAVDLESGVINLERHKTSEKKGARVVPLCSAAVELLDKLPKVLGNPYVIPGNEVGQPLVGLPKIWGRVVDAVAKLQKKNKVPKKDQVNLEGVTLHDLRRSFASLGARLNYPESFTGALLGHAAGSVTAGYSRLGVDPLKDAVEVIGGRMAALLDGKVDLSKEAEERKKAQASPIKTTG